MCTEINQDLANQCLRELNKNLSIIGLTAHAMPEDRAKCLALHP